MAGEVNDGEVNVLFVSISVVALPTRVSVAAGSVSVPDALAAALTSVVPDEAPFTPKRLAWTSPALLISILNPAFTAICTPPEPSLEMVAGKVLDGVTSMWALDLMVPLALPCVPLPTATMPAEMRDIPVSLFHEITLPEESSVSPVFVI